MLSMHLKCVEFFQLQSSYGIKTILIVLVRLYASAHRQVGLFWGKRGTAVKFREKVDVMKTIAHCKTTFRHIGI